MWLVKRNGKVYEVSIPIMFVLAVIVLMVAALIPILSNANIVTARSTLEGQGYTVLEASEYSTINTKLDNIKTSADAAVLGAQNAVIAAQAAVVAANISATKVDLFNSAEVFLFPAATNLTVTLTAGNTNTFGAWAVIQDGASANISAVFATKPGYISDMYIYDHSAVDKLYLVEIADGASKITLGRVMYHTSFIEMAPVKSRRIPAGETVYYRMMCSGANGATAKVGFRYFYE